MRSRCARASRSIAGGRTRRASMHGSSANWHCARNFPVPTAPRSRKSNCSACRRAAQLNQIEAAFAETNALMAQADASQWPPDLVARITDQLASLHNMRAEAQPAYDAATRAIALARAANDDATLMHALENQAFALVRQRRGTQALVPIAEADAIAIKRFGANHRRARRHAAHHRAGATRRRKFWCSDRCARAESGRSCADRPNRTTARSPMR